ncbi:hypothetical protein G7085_00800 [Tessaracoccus sp. HDW20]|uniref:hypothetical protein n=1 Tax=Tessaracoccus coleopterorum TaxID=2714950 RepID=UPI0018D49716|nr:hypothetical protein [Tessaracoccus coleopterorum]NHB83731.1 hypothetical protein [Tessaracoccus coleopterorum]
MSLQLTFLAIGVALTVVGWITGIGQLAFLAWAAWFGATIWASVRAFNGKPSTGVAEPFLLARPHLPVQPPSITR